MESDVVTSRTSSSRSPGGGLARSRTDAGAPFSARLHRPQAPLPREDGRFGRRPSADVLRAGRHRPRTPSLRSRVRPMILKRRRIRIRVGIALGVAALAAVPAADAGSRSRVSTTSFPRIRMTVASKPSAKPPALKENGRAVSSGYRAENLAAAKSVVSPSTARGRCAASPSPTRSLLHRRSFGRSTVRTVAIATFATSPVMLTGFSAQPADAQRSAR